MAYTRWQANWQNDAVGGTPIVEGFLDQVESTFVTNDRRLSNLAINVKTDYGALGDDTTNDATAIQNALNAAAVSGAGAVVFFPAGKYRVGSRLTVPAGTVLQGVNGGSYPANNSLNQVSVLTRMASMNDHLLYLPDGNNHVRIYDLAIDGNKNNNTLGCGLYIADGAVGQESQVIVERCYFHDNPGSNVYLGDNRRANKILNSVLNYAGNATADGITVGGSDNTIHGNIIGGNTRAGICMGTALTQHWAAASPNSAAATSHVTNNDIYGNSVGIAVAQFTAGVMIAHNGIDQNTFEGITVYDGYSVVIMDNTFHSNGVGTNNTYGHVDIASGVSQVSLVGNNFAQLDAGITNRNSYCVTVASSLSQVLSVGNTVAPNSALGAYTNFSGRLLGDTTPFAQQQLYGYREWAFDPAGVSGGSALGAAGTITLIKIPWVVTAPVTNVVVVLTAGGSTLTTGQCFAGLYDSSGARLGVTADQASAWGSAGTTPKTMAITGGPITVTSGGLNGFVYVALLWNGTTSPSFYKAVGSASAILNGSLSAATLRCAVISSAQTTLPSTLTLSGSTGATNLLWAALS